MDQLTRLKQPPSKTSLPRGPQFAALDTAESRETILAKLGLSNHVEQAIGLFSPALSKHMKQALGLFSPGLSRPNLGGQLR